MLAYLLACTPGGESVPWSAAFPDPDAHGGPTGPGGPARTFTEAELYEPCGHVLGGPGDHQHHNLAVMHDGYLLHPWAPEDGGGGISFLDVTDPCEPVVVGQAWADGMRETHTLAIGEAGGREYLAVDYLHPEDGRRGGVGFFDITDRTAPVWVSELETPGFVYPDAYLRVTLASTWVGSLLFVAGSFNGLFVVDVSDPLAPVLLDTWTFDPPHLVGAFHAIGNLGIVASASTPRTVHLDIGDPSDPKPIPGGDWETTDSAGGRHKYYYSSMGGRYGLFTRNDLGGGPLVYDLTDPGAPTFVSEGFTADGDGGYVYRQGDRLFQGDSNFAVFYDFADPAAPVELARVYPQGDVDTTSPIGNVVIVSVDDGGVDGQASTVYPHATAPDADPPAVELVNPADGAVNQPLTSRIGVVFDEWVERATVSEGSFRVADERGRPVPGRFNVQETIVNFTPDAPLAPGTTYVVGVMAGGVTDVSGNAVVDDVVWRFSTGPEVAP